MLEFAFQQHPDDGPTYFTYEKETGWLLGRIVPATGDRPHPWRFYAGAFKDGQPPFDPPVLWEIAHRCTMEVPTDPLPLENPYS